MTRFDRARLAAFVHDVLATVTGRPADLLPFEEVKARLRLKRLVDRGTVEVPLPKIVGTTDRGGEFNRAFLPRDESLRDRWEDVRDLAEGSQGFPSVELYKVGDAYFVVDGHHRVSVARSVGAPTIEARVKEFVTPVPLAPDASLEDVVREEQLAGFLDATGIAPEDPEELRMTDPRGYERLLEHVSGHRFYKGIELGREVAWPEASESWYRTVFRPVIESIRENRVVEEFRGRTEADVYLLAMDHLHRLRKAYGTSAVPPALAVSDLAQKERLRRRKARERLDRTRRRRGAGSAKGGEERTPEAKPDEPPDRG